MRVGLDIGSTTIKCVVLNDAEQIVYSTYERHYSHILEKGKELLHRAAQNYLPDGRAKLAISGSAGMGLADSCKVPFVQEVFATRVAANKLAPGTDCIIELGGEDAKILFLTNGTEVRMNGSCAGGTGAFIDQMATLLKMSADEMDKAAQRLTIPGLGAEVGSYESSYRPFYQGLFLAPHVTAQCAKTALLFARVFESLGYETMPSSREERSDIIQAVRFGGAEELLYFCRAVQAAAPVDSFVSPEPWEMPGYQHPVVMAAGTFVQGATTELSADAPMREPYTAYLQGALTYAHGRLAAMLCADAIVSKKA